MTLSPPVIDSRAAFENAVRWFVQAAADRGARRIVCCDPDFADWPLDDAAVLDALSAWLRGSQRRLVLVASSFERMPRRHPRFVRWRRQWSHAIEAMAPAEPALHAVPTVAFDDGPLGLEVVDRVHWRGQAVIDPRQAFSWRESVQELMHRCEPAFPPDTLGL